MGWHFRCTHMCCPHQSLQLYPPTALLAVLLQTVPTCQNLYKNSFEYYTVSATPPPLDECFQVLGALQMGQGREGGLEGGGERGERVPPL